MTDNISPGYELKMYIKNILVNDPASSGIDDKRLVNRVDSLLGANGELSEVVV